jgi:DNA-binding Xre family transcriptional regulator
MGYKHVGKASPLRRIMTARGLNFLKVAVHAEVALRTIQKVDRMDPKEIGNVKIKSLMKLGRCLGCSPLDLVPFLATRIKQTNEPKVIGSRRGMRGHS